MGLKAYESTSFSLDDCRVPAANLLGGEARYANRREGFRARCARSTRAARSSPPTRSAWAARRSTRRSRSRASTSLLAATRVRDRLEHMARKLRMARLLCLRRAGSRTASGPTSSRRRCARRSPRGVAQEATALGMELLGAVGGARRSPDREALPRREGDGHRRGHRPDPALIMARQLVRYPRDGQE